MKPRLNCKAFTLVELLAVMAIIGILASLVIVSVGHVRAQARSTQCTSNLRSLYVSINSFKQDGRFWLSLNRDTEKDPATYGSQMWFVPLERLGYIETKNQIIGGLNCLYSDVLVCPSNEVDVGAAYTSTSAPYPWRSNYAMSNFWGDTWGQPNVIPGKYPRVNALAGSNGHAILLVDSLSKTGGFYPSAPNNWAQWNGTNCKIPLNLHGKGAHALLMDGAVVTIDPQTYPDLENSKYWDPLYSQ